MKQNDMKQTTDKTTNKKPERRHGRRGRLKFAIRTSLVVAALAAAGASQAAREAARSPAEAGEEPLGRPGRPVLVAPGASGAGPADAKPQRRDAAGETLEPIELCLARLRAVDPFAADVQRCAPGSRSAR